MTNRKQRKAKKIARCIVLLMLPLGIAGAADGVKSLRDMLSETNAVSIEETPSAAVPAKKGKDTSIYAKAQAERTDDDILCGSLILSEGYGITAGTIEDPLLKLESPLETVNNKAGEKPYPTEEQWTSGGDIIRTTYKPYSGTTFFDLKKHGQVNNKTDIPNETLIKESRCLPDFTIEDTSEPQVLIYHTHTTESFEPYVRDNYDSGFNYRTTDDTKNMVMVGDAIEAELEARGIGVIHVETIHDYPSYNGSYGRSRESIVPILEQYPSIKVVLDIHRDAISGEGIAYQPYVEIDGKEAAQVMIISGCDDGTLGMPSYIRNFRFACRLQERLEGDNPGLTRPILFDYRHYNQDLTTGSLLIEVGSHCNTLEQAQYSGQLIGRSLGGMLNDMKED
ncbi:MAG: stage II sporulation protein P [Ruminococcus sp.]|nr:stage II sporulation protein P [Ruminococcus sp.]